MEMNFAAKVVSQIAMGDTTRARTMPASERPPVIPGSPLLDESVNRLLGGGHSISAIPPWMETGPM